jgi:hypothetical protein
MEDNCKSSSVYKKWKAFNSCGFCHSPSYTCDSY